MCPGPVSRTRGPAEPIEDRGPRTEDNETSHEIGVRGPWGPLGLIPIPDLFSRVDMIFGLDCFGLDWFLGVAPRLAHPGRSPWSSSSWIVASWPCGSWPVAFGSGPWSSRLARPRLVTRGSWQWLSGCRGP
eukprot:9254370-Pyramimonas_sp.AAC.1